MSARASQSLAQRRRVQRMVAFGLALAMTMGAAALTLGKGQEDARHAPPAKPGPAGEAAFYPTPAQWQTIGVGVIDERVFRAEHVTEGKLAVDEDRSTPIYSPYSGRVTRLLVKPGDRVQRGQRLFVVEASDTVQAQNDFIASRTALNKARSQLELARIIEQRNRELFDAKAVALKEWQQAQAAMIAAENDLRSAEGAQEAARNRLRLLGRGDADIAALDKLGAINPETAVNAPIDGTIVLRKVGPGQYVSGGATDPVFVLGDLSTVWLLAYVRESDAPKVRVGQDVAFTVLAYPNRSFTAKIDFVATALDPATRRLLVRATIDNADANLKPEMFASVSIFTEGGGPCPAIPREAVIYEGENARAWLVRPDNGLVLRRIKLGLINGGFVQVLDGLQAGDRVVTKGSLFIDRAATAGG